MRRLNLVSFVILCALLSLCLGCGHRNVYTKQPVYQPFDTVLVSVRDAAVEATTTEGGPADSELRDFALAEELQAQLLARIKEIGVFSAVRAKDAPGEIVGKALRIDAVITEYSSQNNKPLIFGTQIHIVDDKSGAGFGSSTFRQVVSGQGSGTVGSAFFRKHAPEVANEEKMKAVEQLSPFSNLMSEIVDEVVSRFYVSQ